MESEKGSEEEVAQMPSVKQLAMKFKSSSNQVHLKPTHQPATTNPKITALQQSLVKKVTGKDPTTPPPLVKSKSTAEEELKTLPASNSEKPLTKTPSIAEKSLAGAEKPPTKTASNTEKLPTKTPSITEKPLTETVSNAEKPPTETVSNAEKPTAKTVSNAEKPTAKTVSIAEEPTAKTVSNAEEPPTKTVSNAEEPPTKTSSITEEPPTKTHLITEEPPTNTTSITEKPPTNTPSNIPKEVTFPVVTTTVPHQNQLTDRSEVNGIQEQTLVKITQVERKENSIEKDQSRLQNGKHLTPLIIKAPEEQQVDDNDNEVFSPPLPQTPQPTKTPFIPPMPKTPPPNKTPIFSDILDTNQVEEQNIKDVLLNITPVGETTEELTHLNKNNGDSTWDAFAEINNNLKRLNSNKLSTSLSITEIDGKTPEDQISLNTESKENVGTITEPTSLQTTNKEDPWKDEQIETVEDSNSEKVIESKDGEQGIAEKTLEKPSENNKPEEAARVIYSRQSSDVVNSSVAPEMKRESGPAEPKPFLRKPSVPPIMNSDPDRRKTAMEVLATPPPMMPKEEKELLRLRKQILRASRTSVGSQME